MQMGSATREDGGQDDLYGTAPGPARRMGSSAVPTKQNTQAASYLLQRLLASDPDYLARWHKHAKRTGERLNQSAIANVLDEYLFQSGERCEADTSRTLKDKVSRALSGSVLTAGTLTWFIDAFEMKECDSTLLRETLGGGHPCHRGVSHTLRQKRELVRRQRHRTISLVERYVIGPEGTPTTRYTCQIIRATEGGVDSYVFNHEPEASGITVLQGGRLGKRFVYGGGLHGVEIFFDNPLNESQVAVLEYETIFRSGFPCPTEVRRPAFARAETFALTVQFPEHRRPSAAWLCVWDDHFSEKPVREEFTSLKKNLLYCYFPYIEETVVGFRWKW